MEIPLTHLGLPEMILLQLLVVAVSAAAGIVAFGFAMAMTPFFLIFLDARLVIEMNIVLTAVLFATVSPQVHRHLIPGTLAAMLLGGALGIYPGLLIVQSLPKEALSLTLTSVVIVTALLALLNRFPHFRREKIAGGVVGFVFTFINAGLALGGPIAALFAFNQRWVRDQTRAMLSYVLPGDRPRYHRGPRHQRKAGRAGVLQRRPLRPGPSSGQPHSLQAGRPRQRGPIPEAGRGRPAGHQLWHPGSGDCRCSLEQPPGYLLQLRHHL